MSLQNCNEVVEISDSESENETVPVQSPYYRSGTPYPDTTDATSEYDNHIRSLNRELNVSRNQLEKAVEHHLRFAIMVYTRLHAVMNGYENSGEYF